MKLNGLKFEHLKYGKNEEQKDHSIYYSDTGSRIETKSTIKDLGIIFDVNSTFDIHIDTLIERIKSINSWIYRTFSTRDVLTMLTLWKSLVLPHIDYCSQLWSPTKRYQIQKLEALQKCYLNGISKLKHLNYWQKLKATKLYSLERRRERYRIIYTWNILENNVPNFNYSDTKGGIFSYQNQRRGLKCHLKDVNIRHRNIWRGCLSEEGPRLFNSLPRYLCDLN